MSLMREKAKKLRMEVQRRIRNGIDREIIANLYVLDTIFKGEIPVGNHELSPNELDEQLYEARKKIADLRYQINAILAWCNYSGTPTEQCLHEIERIAQGALGPPATKTEKQK